MGASAPRVIVVAPPKTWIAGAIAEDLRAGGFELETLTSGARALEAARARPPVAFVVVEGMPAGWTRRLAREPSLRAVPVVGVTGAEPERPRFVPLLALLRCDGWVQTERLRTSGAAAGAVRDAVARGKLAPPDARERLGAWLWRLGSALAVLAFAAGLWMVVQVLGLRPMTPVTLWVMMATLLGFPVGTIGTQLARGRPARLGAGNWLLVAVVAVGAALLARAVGNAS